MIKKESGKRILAVTFGLLLALTLVVVLAPSAPAANSPHAFYTATTAKCATCHRSHTAGGSNLLLSASPQSQLCFTCHDGTGATTNVSAEWSDPSVPANDSGTSAFYSHPATTASNHSRAPQDEFQGVLNRHSECGDCHNPHAVDTTAGNVSADGWTASGALKGISGVGVTNGGAGTTTTFTWKKSITYEYELCFKCHSSYTNLLSYTTPSYKKEDKAKEFNPNNYSYHPVEAPGKNQTTRMAGSLSGTSSYKVWSLTTTDVIRCTNCHAYYQNNTNFSPHASKYMGILRYNYRDRVLRTSAETYNAADFALCFTCHTDGPYTDKSGDPRSDTNFRFHGFHTYKSLTGGSASTDINVPGAGDGPTLCAECHWRIHGNTGTVAANSKRLVSFAPNVQPSSTSDATGSFGPKFILLTEGNPDTGACLLKCHGKDHNTMPNGSNNYRYDY